MRISEFEDVKTIYTANRRLCANIPDSKILYSLPHQASSLLSAGNKVSEHILIAKLGMKTFDDFQFLRLRHEVKVRDIGSDRRNGNLFRKGGEQFPCSTWICHYLCVGQGMDLKLQKKTERSTDKRLKLGKHRFLIDNRGGLTQGRRKISEWRVLPAGCIIGEKGPASTSPKRL